LSSSRSRRSKGGDFFLVRRDAVLFVTGLAVLCGVSVLAGDVLPPIHRAASSVAARSDVLKIAPEPLSASASQAAADKAVEHVSSPWQAGQAQLGVDVYWAEQTAESDAVVDAKIVKTVDYAVSLGANWISVSFPFVTTGVHADEVSASPTMTPSLARLQTFVQIARSAGLHVALRPILDETALVKQDPNAWRGSIDPADFADWFAGYRSLLATYAQLAQQTGVGAFYVSTELTSMEGFTDDWTALIAAIRQIYTGPLYDSINYNRLPPGDTKIPGADLAVDAYFPMTGLGDDATVAQLVAGWDTWLDQYSTGDLSDLTFSEAGIVPEDGAYQSPYIWNSDATPDPQIQTRWYEAACQVAQQRHVAGIYWWYLNLENADEPADTPVSADPMSFLDTPGAAVIKSCFAGFSG
jgi:hypothetical protein